MKHSVNREEKIVAHYRLFRSLTSTSTMNFNFNDERARRELQEMKHSMNREEKIGEVKAKLTAGVAAEDLAALNKALAMAIELGCEGDVDVQVHINL
jgi:hypothetical protein